MTGMTDPWPEGIPARARRSLEAAAYARLADLAGVAMLEVADH